jgi:hypothetical protein
MRIIDAQIHPWRKGVASKLARQAHTEARRT